MRRKWPLAALAMVAVGCHRPQPSLYEMARASVMAKYPADAQPHFPGPRDIQVSMKVGGARTVAGTLEEVGSMHRKMGFACYFVKKWDGHLEVADVRLEPLEDPGEPAPRPVDSH